MASAFSGRLLARTGSTSAWASPLRNAVQIALFVAPVLVLLSYVLGPTPMDLHFWPKAACAMMLIATLTAGTGYQQRPLRLVSRASSSSWYT